MSLIILVKITPKLFEEGTGQHVKIVGGERREHVKIIWGRGEGSVSNSFNGRSRQNHLKEGGGSTSKLFEGGEGENVKII